jgi:hypothetical protein
VEVDDEAIADKLVVANALDGGYVFDSSLLGQGLGVKQRGGDD